MVYVKNKTIQTLDSYTSTIFSLHYQQTITVKLAAKHKTQPTKLMCILFSQPRPPHPLAATRNTRISRASPQMSLLQAAAAGALFRRLRRHSTAAICGADKPLSPAQLRPGVHRVGRVVTLT